MEEKSKHKKLVWILAIIIIILIGVISYSSLLKPSFDNYIQQKQIDAYNLGQSDLIIAIVNQIQQKGAVQIPVGNNQSIVLVPNQGV